tara:strand:+ start:86 stop:574 length:489 start_codon:yes stop_codon:yes gene_type:complete
VGVESEGEQIEIELKAFLPPETAMTKLNAKLSKEMQIVSSQEVDGSFPTSGSQGKFEVVLFMDRIPCLAGWSRISYERAIDDLLAKKEIHIHKSKNGVDRVIDIRPSIADIAISSVQEDQVVLNLKLHLGAGGVSILRDLARENYGLRPEEIASLEIKKLRE